MITLDSEHPPVGIWMMNLDAINADFLAALTGVKDKPREFHLDYRFRYHRDDKVFDSEDEKHWYHVEFLDIQEDDAIAKVRDVVLKIGQIPGWDTEEERPTLDELLYRDYNDFHRFMEAFQNRPWAYVKSNPTSEECERWGIPPKPSKS
jgi:hypothetical protein